jgi:nucleotide-binding universal stress UspA family protein
MRHPIVCGIDGSKESRLAARVAAELARALGRGLVLVHATDDPPTFPYGDIRLRELQRRSATHAANRLLEDVAAALPTIGLETRIVFGDPGEALDALCRDRDASLLVLGTRGRSGLRASLTARLASAGGCPVVAVPLDAAERFLRGQHSSGSDGAGESTRALQVAGELANAA